MGALFPWRYMVGTQLNFLDPQNWSYESGGDPGAYPPTEGDIAILDENSPWNCYYLIGAGSRVRCSFKTDLCQEPFTNHFFGLYISDGGSLELESDLQCNTFTCDYMSNFDARGYDISGYDLFFYADIGRTIDLRGSTITHLYRYDKRSRWRRFCLWKDGGEILTDTNTNLALHSAANSYPYVRYLDIYDWVQEGGGDNIAFGKIEILNTPYEITAPCGPNAPDDSGIVYCSSLSIRSGGTRKVTGYVHFLVNGDVTIGPYQDDQILYLGEKHDDDRWKIKITKGSGRVTAMNTSLINTTVSGGARFNAFLKDGNIDAGYNVGWNWYGQINMKQALADPAAIDAGNKEIQRRVVSKTIQTAYFTNNKNAVWAGQQHLRKSSYPFATINFPAHRKAFRYDIGDCFKFSYAKYGVVDMICRVMQIQEDSPESEVIKITAMEDIFSCNSVITQYLNPSQRAILANDYSIDPLENQKMFEVPYYFVSDDSIASASVEVLAIAARENPNDLGFDVYMSVDDGSSYQLITRAPVLIPYGTLVAVYSNATFSIDDEGFVVSFAEKVAQDIDEIETITWGETFAGTNNLALLGNEIISFQSIVPITETEYRLSGIIRGRYGTQKQNHSIGEDFYILNESTTRFSHSEINNGVTRQFKFVPYNLKFSGDISEATAIELAIVGKAATPYIPINFCANGSSFAARYG